MIGDYADFMKAQVGLCFMVPDECRRYADNFDIRYGKKYIKIVCNNSVAAFVVGVDNDKKFKKGDILN